MTSYNLEMINNFNKGVIVEYLVGEGKFFIRDHTWGVHSTTYVLDALEEWATENKIPNQEIYNYVLEGFLELEKRGNIENYVYLLHGVIFLSKHHEYKTNLYSKIDFTKILDTVVPFLTKNASVFVSNEWLRGCVLECCERLPKLGEKLGISNNL